MKILQELLALKEGKNPTYQVKIETVRNGRSTTSDWKDLELPYASLEEMKAALISTEANLGSFTEIIEDYIGNNDGSWDEMEIEFESLKHDVLKVHFAFSGYNPRLKDEFKNKGTITIMP